MTHPPHVRTVLEAEHRWIDERFQHFQHGLEAGHHDAHPFDEAAQRLHRHIYLEEELLFPRVETRGLAGPTAVMAQEHGEICRQLDAIGSLLASDAATNSIREALGHLRGLLEAHNVKEEQILYPACDEVLTELEAAELVERLQEAEAPEGWLCRAHRIGEA